MRENLILRKAFCALYRLGDYNAHCIYFYIPNIFLYLVTNFHFFPPMKNEKFGHLPLN